MITATIKTDFTALHGLKAAMKKSIMKKAVRQGANVVKNYLKTSAPNKTGTLRKSISVKVDAKKESQVVFAVVGPRSSYKKNIKGRVLQPSRYAYPLNYHHPFLLPAWQATKGLYTKTVATVVGQQIEAQLSK